MHPVDLRWGVTEDDVAVEVCLGEVESCAPFFVGVVGSRWGFVPDINADSLAKWPWIRDLRPKPSVTCLEIHAGALNKLHNTRSVIALRDNVSALIYSQLFVCLTLLKGFMPDVPPGYRSDFASETPAAAQELEILKDDIRNAAAEADPKRFAVLDNYHSSWKGVVDNKPLVGDLEKFGDFILENLWVFMQEEVRRACCIAIDRPNTDRRSLPPNKWTSIHCQSNAAITSHSSKVTLDCSWAVIL